MAYHQQEPVQCMPHPCVTSSSVCSAAQELETRGFFSDEGDDGTQVPIGQKTELGALKRAQVRLARARPDIVYSLAEDKVARIAAAPLPFPDRKARLHLSCSRRRSCALFICYIS